MIDSIKSTAVVLGFLFGLSIAYYLSFWSNFNIDVFQYIALEDIIKGVAYPLRYAGFLLLFFVAYMLLAVVAGEYYASNRAAPNKVPFWTLLISFVLLAVCYALFYFHKIRGNIFPVGLMLSLIASALFFSIYETADTVYNKEKKDALTQNIPFDKKHPAIEFLNSVIITAVVFLFASAITLGQSDARDIIEGKRFNYVMISNIPKDKIHTQQPYLILLGAISEKYIFIDCSHSEHFFVDKDDMHTLQTLQFNVKDTVSVQRFQSALFK